MFAFCYAGFSSFVLHLTLIIYPSLTVRDIEPIRSFAIACSNFSFRSQAFAGSCYTLIILNEVPHVLISNSDSRMKADPTHVGPCLL